MPPKGDQRGQGPLLIRNTTDDALYRFERYQATARRLGITREADAITTPVPIRTTHIKAIGIPAGIKHLFPL